MAKSFWDFPACSKIDILDENKHAHLILASLRDLSTGVEPVDHTTYTIYGANEALLVQTVSMPLRIALMVYGRVVSFVTHPTSSN